MKPITTCLQASFQKDITPFKMSYLHARTVIAYHGCDLKIAERLLEGGPFKESRNAWDWLGRGVYFWEYGARRALEWAQTQAEQAPDTDPAVIGAVIQLGKCFDLLDIAATTGLADFYPAFASDFSERTGSPLPTNLGGSPEKKARFRDCAVINNYLDVIEQAGESYDTVRGAFQEGEPVFPGAFIHRQSHIQIAVRNPACILGVFRPVQGGIEGEPDASVL